MAHIIGFVREFYDRNHEWTIHMWKISWRTSLPISRWNRGYFSRQNCCRQDPYTMGHSYWLTNRTPNNTFQHAAGPYLCKIQPADPGHLTQPDQINTTQWLNPYQKISGKKGSKSKCIKSNSLFWQKATLDPPLIRFDTQKYFIPSYCTVQKYFCISSFLQIFSTFSMV